MDPPRYVLVSRARKSPPRDSGGLLCAGGSTPGVWSVRRSDRLNHVPSVAIPLDESKRRAPRRRYVECGRRSIVTPSARIRHGARATRAPAPPNVPFVTERGGGDEPGGAHRRGCLGRGGLGRGGDVPARRLA